MSVENKVIYVVKDVLNDYPPCVSQIAMICKLGYKVYVICENCAETTLNVIKSAGAEVRLLGNLLPKRNLYGRICHWIKFKNKALSEIDNIYNDGDIIWIGTERTGMVIGNSLKNKKTILNVLELYDRYSLFGRFVGRIIGNMQAVVSCELTRARIMKLWYNLEDVPYVMQNKPYYEIAGEKSEDVYDIQKKLKGKKYILYQGILNEERPLDTIVQALNNTKEHYFFVITGIGVSKEKDKEMIKRLQSIYPDVIYGGYFPAPQHLYITENAHIGVAIYDTSSLNTMFCAPNKTFEYSKFSVPILGSDIPGLQLTVEKHGAGICVDIDNYGEIAKAIDKISENYAEYQKGAEAFYNSVDNLEITREILKNMID